MKDFRRLIALLVTVCMLSSMVVFSADVENANESVVADEVYQEEIAKLSALGLWALADVENASEAQVTRGEFAELMVTLIGMKDQNTIASPIFRDVTAQNPHYNAVAVLHALKIVSGEYGSLFRPDDAITYNEAMKLLMSVLGYNIYADEVGGYPVGYMKAAREQGLSLSNVSGEQRLTRSNVSALLVAALDVPILKRYTYGKGAISYNKADNVTILSEYFKIFRSLGILNAVGPTRIDEGSRLSEGIAELEGVTFNVGATNAIDYIGYRVYGYFKEDKNAARNTLVYIEPANNTVYDLDSDEISSYDPVTEKLSYFTDVERGKKSTITIRKTDNIIYNNVRTKDFSKDDFETADRIRAIDNNNDGSFEAVFIESEEIFMVKSVNTSDFKIFDNYRAGGILDIESDGKVKVISFVDRYGNLVDVNTITFGSVLNVVRSKPDASGAMVTTVVVTNQKFTGTVTEIIQEGDDLVYVIGDTKYYFAKNQNDIIGLDQVKIGGSYRFYLDKNNDIAGIDITASTSEQYGFLVKASMKNKIEMQPEVRVYTTNREFLDTKLADNVKINNKRLTGLASLNELLGEGRELAQAPSGSVIVGRAIRYRLNANKEISYILTGTPAGPNDTEENYPYGKNIMQQFPLTSNPMYLRDVGLFDGRIRIDGNTAVFIIPQSENDYDDIEKYGIGNMDTFKSFAGVNKNNIKFYDLSKERIASLVVYANKKPGGTEIDRNTRITVVTKISKVVDEEGTEVYKLYGLQSGKEISIQAAPEVTFERKFYYTNPFKNVVYDKNNPYIQTVERGDIIRYATNADGELDDYEKVFDLSDDDDPNFLTRFSYVGYNNADLEDDDPSNNTPDTATDSAMQGMYCMISITDQFPVISSGKETDSRFHMVHHGSNQHYFYAVQYKVYYATLMDKVGDTIFYKVGPSPSMGNGKTEIASLSRFSITVIDKTQDLIYQSNESELSPASVVGEANATKMIMYLAGGIPRDIIIIKQ